MRKLNRVYFCIIFFSLFSSLNLFSQNAGVTTIGSDTACLGTTITIPLNISNSPDLSGIALRIEYDGTVLSFLQTGNVGTGVSNTNANLLANGGNISGAQTTVSGTTKKLMLVWISGDGNGYTVSTNGTGLLCNLQFRYLGGNTSLTFNNSALLGSQCEYADNNGVALNDTPTSTYFIDGSVVSGSVPSIIGNITGNTSSCQGSTSVYSVVNSGGITYSWTAPSTWAGTSTTNSISYTTGVLSGNIIVIPSNACGNGTALSIYITVDTNSVIPTSLIVTPDSICSGVPSTLSETGGVLGTGGIWNWYSGACGGISIGTGTSIIQTPTVTTTFYLRAEGTCNTTTCISKILTVISQPAIPTSAVASPNIISSGQSSTLNVTGTLSTGEIWSWYINGCGSGTSIGTGNLLVYPTSNTTYFVRTENGTCYSACLSSTITVSGSLNNPDSIVAVPDTVCVGAQTTLNVVGTLNGGQWHWYSNSCAGTFIGTGDPIIYTLVSDTIFYVRQESGTNYSNCVSKTITLLTSSIQATSVNATLSTVCQGDSTILTASGGLLGSSAIWNWYSATCGGTSIGTGINLTQYPLGTTVYYVRAEGTCNTTACVSTLVTVIQPLSPTIATSLPDTINVGQSSVLSVNGTLSTGEIWSWYINGCGSGTSIGTGNLLVYPTSNTTYFVRTENGACFSSCLSVTVTISSALNDPINITSPSDTICLGMQTMLNVNGTLNGGQWSWYIGSCGGTYLNSGTSIMVSPTSDTVFYVRQESGTNYSNCVSNTVIVFLPSTQPTSANAVPLTICPGDSVVFSVTGGSLGTGANWFWFNGSCGGNLIGTGVSIRRFIPFSNMFYVRAQGNCGGTNCDSVYINVNTPSLVATNIIAAPQTICNGTSSNLSISGGTLGSGSNWYWYSGSCGNNLEGSGSSIFVTPVINTTYYVRAEGPCNTTSCLSADIIVNDTSSIATNIIANPQSVCNGTSSNLSISGGTLGTVSNWYWYSGSCGSFSEGSGISILVTPSLSTTYYVRAEGTCNTTTCISVILTVNSQPLMPTSLTVLPSSIYVGQSSTLTITGSLSPGEVWSWYTNSCGSGTSIGTGSSLLVYPTTTITYFVRSENNTCYSSCLFSTVTVLGSLNDPDSITAIPDTICAGMQTTLSVAGTLNGGQWYWYSNSCGGNYIGTGDTIVYIPTSDSIYYVRQETGTIYSNCVSKTITLLTSSTQAISITATLSTICKGNSTNLTTTGGLLGTVSDWYWYSGVCGSNLEGTSNSILVSPVITTTYYVRAEGTCNTTSCVSLEIIVNDSSTTATNIVASSQNICNGSSSNLSISGGTLGSGSDWYWYSAGCGNSLESTGTSILVTPVITTTYYVRAEGTCNTTSCVSLEIIVNDSSLIATNIIAVPQTICNGTSSNLNISGGVLGTGSDWYWYSGGCGSNLEGTSNTLLVSPLITTTYYVRAEGTCNTTSCVSLEIIVNDSSLIATNIIAAPQTICNGTSSNLNISGGTLGSGSDWYWYSGICGSNLESTGASILVTPAITTTYYVRAEGACNTTSCVSLEIIVNDTSSVATNIIATPQSICNGSSSNLSISGGALGTGSDWYWYSGGCGSILESTGASILVTPSLTTTYYVRAEGVCNTTSCISLEIIVNDTSITATNIVASLQNICIGSSSNLSVLGGTLVSGSDWYWYSGGCGNTFEGTGISILVTPSLNTTYYVRAEGICNTTLCISNSITVFPTPIDPIFAQSNPDTITVGLSSEITVNGILTSGASWIWYENGCGTGIIVASGDTVTIYPPATTTYYVRAENGICYSNCVSTSVIIPGSLNGPGVVSANPNPVCIGQPTTLGLTGTLNGGQWNWYLNSCGGTLIGTGNSIIVNSITDSIYFVRQENGGFVSSCGSVVANFNSFSIAPSGITATPNIVCSGTPTSLLVLGGTLGSGSIWKWYTGSCGGILIGTGTNIVNNPTATTYYYLRAEGTCNTTACLSVEVVINTSSVSAITAVGVPSTICTGDTTTLTKIGGSLIGGANWYWYSGSCGGLFVGTGSSTAQLPLVTTTYYLRAEGTCNTTNCVTKTIIVNIESIPAISAISSSSVICSGSNDTLSLIGGSLGTNSKWVWYSGICGSTYVGTGLSIVVHPLLSTNYFVRAQGTCNTTVCVSVNITVQQQSTIMSGVVANNYNVCIGNSTVLSITGGVLGTGANWKWYESSCGGLLVGSGTVTTQFPIATTTYYVRAEGLCNTTLCKTITIQTQLLSQIADSVSAKYGIICQGNTDTLSISGGTLGNGAVWKYYTVSCGGLLFGSGAVINVNPVQTTTYFVRAEGACNTTTCLSITINVNSNSINPTIALANPSVICSGLSTSLNILGGTLGNGSNWYWYSGICGGTYAGTGTFIIQNPVSTTTYYVRAEGACSTTSCLSVTVLVDSLSQPPANISAVYGSICTGGTDTLSIIGGALGNGAVWKFYTSTCGGILAGTGTTLIVSPVNSTIYFARAEGLCNTTNCVSITITVNTPSTNINNIIANPASICIGSSSLIQTTGGVLGTGANFNWYSGSCGGTFVGSGTSIYQSPSISDTYYVRAEGTCNTTLCKSITIFVDTISTIPVSINAKYGTICIGGIDTLSVQGGNLSIGSVWKWYYGGCGTIIAGTGVSLIINPAYTTNYYVRAEGICNTTSCISITEVVNNYSVLNNASILSPVSTCQGSSATLYISGGVLGTGANWYWYSGICGGTALDTGANIIQNPMLTTTYYVRAEGLCNTTSCISVSIVVDSISIPALFVTSSSSQICNGSIDTLIVNGGTLGTAADWNWYSGNCGGTIENIGDSIIVSPLLTTVYYVRAEGLCNTTSCVSITLVVNSNSTPALSISALPSSVCIGNSVQLTKSGGYIGTVANWNWYSGTCGGTYIGSGTIINQLPIATTTYYVRAEGICNTTSCISITVIVDSLSTSPLSISASFPVICVGDTSTLTEIGGVLGSSSVFKWYKGYCGGVPVDTGINISVNPLVTTNYYVRAEGICNTTSCVSYTITVNSISTRATSIIATPSTICIGDSTILMKTGGFLGTGANWSWYSNGCGSTLVGTGTSINTYPANTTIYWVRAEGTCNTTICVSQTITVNTNSILPVNISALPDSICMGDTSLITISGGSLGTLGDWYWYQGNCGGSNIGIGDTLVVMPNSTSVYYVRAAGLCNTTNCISVTIIVNTYSSASTGVISTPSSLCTGGTSILSVTSGTLGSEANWYWYSGSCGGSLIGSGASIAQSPVSTTNYYVRAEGSCNTTICDSVTVILNSVSSPATTILTTPSSTICSGSPVTLISFGGSLGTLGKWYWYLGSCGGTTVGTGLTMIVSPTNSTTYYVRAEGPCNTTSCLSVNITVITVPVQPSIIVGSTNPAFGTSQPYSVTNDPSVTYYSWTAPIGWTGTSSTNSIIYLAGSGSGTITVIPSNSCGNGIPRTLNVNTGFKISGYFTYNNLSNTALDSVKIYLSQNSNIIDSTQADINGYYEFNNKPNGIYNITASTNKPWSGVNSTDATKVIRHFNGLELLTSSIKLHSADVNLSLSINSTDASKITRRFLEYDTSFTRGDWIFEKPLGGDTINVSANYNDTVFINGNDVIQNFKGLCVGDVNCSNIPGIGAKSQMQIKLIEEGMLKINKDEDFEIPIKVNKQMDLSAISLILNYQSDIIEIKEIVSDSYQILYNVSNKEVRIAWFDLNSKNINSNEVLLKLKVQLKGNIKSINNILTINDSYLNELADENGSSVEGVELSIPKIECNNTLVNFADITKNDVKIYPNPANDKLYISCLLAETGQIKISLYNLLGEKVKELKNEGQLTGVITKECNISELLPGVYMCKVEFIGNNNKFKKLFKVIIAR